MELLGLLATLCLSTTLVSAAPSWTATPFNPPSVPLAVRSPYLSAWLNQGAGTALNGAWPMFWTGSIVGWAGFAKVDGVAYNWLGDPAVPHANFTKATQKSLEITSTQSVFVMTAGPVDLTITFLSPVEPADVVNQSFPFSYLAISAASNDGKDHSVQVYSDISGEWISGDNSLLAQWTTTTGDLFTHEVHLASRTPFTEANNRAQYGSAYHSTLKTNGTTFQTGQDIIVRAQFINQGVLLNAEDTKFRAVSADWPIFALAHDLGTVNSPSAPAVFSVGFERDPAIQYIVANSQLQQRSLAWRSRYSLTSEAILTFLNDYENALARAKALDAQVNKDASKVSGDYASIVALSIRQAFGASEITLCKTSSGDFNTSDIMVFMKELSSDGNVNTVDVIFPAWPMYLYINPVLGKQLLLPLLEYQATGQYPNTWAVHDVGASYPNATGHNDGEDLPMPIEESGNMLIMVLSYTQRTNDTSLVQSYYTLFDKWAQYLVQNTLLPKNQFSTDDFAGELANQTNLAIKGIIGIKAMSKIADIAGDSAKSSSYSSTADQLVQQWQKLAMSSDGTHLTLAYGNSSSWGLAYNLYADKLLGTGVIPESLYDLQTKWYSGRANAFGVPLDTRHTYSKTDWQIWTSALVTDNSVRDMFINSVRKYAADGNNSQPLADWYETLDGTAKDTRARPVVGGHLALLALQSNSSIAPSWPTIGSPSNTSMPGSSETPPDGASTSSSSSNTGPPSPTESGSNAGAQSFGSLNLQATVWIVLASIVGAIVWM
ncbi:DUF1793-domain-containing protein [Trametes cingulata]|nr:DUF1793-domain-containing protein [Trametes cingulata]